MYLSPAEFEKTKREKIAIEAETIASKIDIKLKESALAYMDAERTVPIEIVLNEVVPLMIREYISQTYVSRGWVKVTSAPAESSTVFNFLLQ